MEDVILIIAVVAAMIFVFFIANRLDVFLEENRKAIKKEQEEKYSPLEFIDTENFMMLIYKYNSFEELTPEILRVHRKSRCSRKDESRRTLQTNGRNLLQFRRSNRPTDMG